MIRITLSGSGGVLDAVDIGPLDSDSQRRIKATIAEWTLAPGDIIRIDAATDYEDAGQFEIGARLRDQRRSQR